VTLLDPVDPWPRTAGAELVPLVAHRDDRGSFTEVFRSGDEVALQWNVVRSRAGALRGVHVHHRHDDWFHLIEGTAFVGLHDLRRGSASCGRPELIRLDAATPTMLRVPHGVAHGLQFLDDSVLLAGFSHLHDPLDDLGCAWDDPALGFDWPIPAPVLSERDRTATSFRSLLEAVEPYQPFAS
jgi:dTDP-4-dehydrorhamnose 3,5-epimerase